MAKKRLRVGVMMKLSSQFCSSYNDLHIFHTFVVRPDLIEYEKLTKSEPEKNLNLAFEVAETQLEIPQLLEAEGLLKV